MYIIEWSDQAKICFGIRSGDKSFLYNQFNNLHVKYYWLGVCVKVTQGDCKILNV